MAGDEIVADWLGDVTSFRVETSAIVTRFQATSKRFRNVHIHVADAVDCGYVGMYHSTYATFKNGAIWVGSLDTIKFEYIDLYELAYAWDGAAVYLKVLGINEY